MRQFEALTANARRSSDASPLLLAREISCEKASDCSEASSSEPEEAASGSGACDVVNSSPSRWPLSHPGAYVVQRIFKDVSPAPENKQGARLPVQAVFAKKGLALATAESLVAVVRRAPTVRGRSVECRVQTPIAVTGGCFK